MNNIKCWRYQIIKHSPKKSSPTELYYGIHEVYVDNKGKVVTWTVNPEIISESAEGLFEALDMMRKDAKQYPILDEKDFPEE